MATKIGWVGGWGWGVIGLVGWLLWWGFGVVGVGGWVGVSSHIVWPQRTVLQKPVFEEYFIYIRWRGILIVIALKKQRITMKRPIVLWCRFSVIRKSFSGIRNSIFWYRKIFFYNKNRNFWYQEYDIWLIIILISENRNTWISDIKNRGHFLVAGSYFLVSKMIFWHEKLIDGSRKSFSNIKDSR